MTQMRNISSTAKDTANSGLVKALQQAAMIESIGSEGDTVNASPTKPLFNHPALICAWIGGMPAV